MTKLNWEKKMPVYERLKPRGSFKKRATVKQLKFMRKVGIKILGGMTMTKASILISEFINKKNKSSR